MIQQVIFISVLILTLGVFTFTVLRLGSFFKLTRSFPINNIPARIAIVMKVAIGQTKIFRFPFVGVLHALVFWGFLIILLGSIEMIVDGIAGTEHVFSFLGPVYSVIMAAGDVFAFIIMIAIGIFLGRRLFITVKRFSGFEMTHRSHTDATIALTLIFFLMISLLGMNASYYALHPDDLKEFYPVSQISGYYMSFAPHFINHNFYEIFWWMHILLVFIFANVLPYSKHFHVFMSVPNVFLSRLDPLGKLPNMDNITKEVRSMMDPATAYASPASDAPIERFGVKDVQDVTWKNYLDSLSCTQCGRCTSVCPANTTGKKLSPRKIMMDLRHRMTDIGPSLVKNGKEFTDNKAYLRDYVSTEEIWACTTCNACAMECPININHPTLIVDLRRYLVMEESSAPGGVNVMFTNISNNGAPWQFSPQDRMIWANELYVKDKRST